MLLYVAELMLDFVLINQKQAKTGMGDIAKCMKDRQMYPLDKRVTVKMGGFGSVSLNEFF